MVDGQGQLAVGGLEYTYPPLWRKHSCKDGAGLFHISSFAEYVKNNMPMGTTHNNPMHSDEEAWDEAAFINSQSRPHMKATNDWPDVAKKPIDHLFGPYTTAFSDKQHKFWPFLPIFEAQKELL